MKRDFSNAPVTEPYARDLILEAHARLVSDFPSGKDLVFVEFYEVPGMALISDDSVVLYHPDIVKQVPLDNLIELLKSVMYLHMMNVTDQLDTEDMIIPPGTTLH